MFARSGSFSARCWRPRELRHLVASKCRASQASRSVLPSILKKAVRGQWDGSDMTGPKSRFMVVALLFVAVSLFGGRSLAAQSTATSPSPTQTAGAKPAPEPEWQKAAGGSMRFEVASIRESPSQSLYRANVSLDPYDDKPPTGELFSANAPLAAYIIFAYKLLETSQFRDLIGKLPGWAQTNYFDIEARADRTPTKDQMRLMMQDLLRDRFKMVTHVETKERPVYAVMLDHPGKPGPGLKPHPADETCAERPDNYTGMPRDKTHPLICGVDAWQEDGQMHFRLVNVTMAQVASMLSGLGSFQGDTGQRPIVDASGLSGRFDVNLVFAMPQVKQAMPDSQPPQPEGPSAIQAMGAQLGLKLVKEDVPVDTFAIDHIEMPTAN